MATSNTITLPNGNNSWDTLTLSRGSNIETFKTDEDLLFLSCAIYRLRNAEYADPVLANRFKCLSLTDDNISQYVTDADRELAQTIKTHFQKKFLVLALKSTKLTMFREDLNRFLNSRWDNDPAGVYIYPKAFIGLAYKLPYLYFYDLEMQKVFGCEYFAIKGPDSLRGRKTLKHIKTIKPFRKYQNGIEFWFEDELGNRVMLTVDKTNPLLNVFDRMIAEPVHLEGKFEMRMKDTLQYYNSPMWKCVV